VNAFHQPGGRNSGNKPLTAAYRQPTIAEAVAFVLQSQTREYRQKCLQHWREKYGDQFADEVEERVKRTWKTKR
jgi:hypothetical protein